jgi:UDP-3-O-[3-hydroxymyristoyl] glucosamine N-acyltransferase
MQLSVQDIARMIDAKVIGDENKIISGVASFEDATGNDITFASDTRFIKKLEQCRAGVIILPEQMTSQMDSSDTTTYLLCANPKLSFFEMVAYFFPQKKQPPGYHPTAEIGSHFQSGNNCSVGARVIICDNVCLGNNVTVMPGVFIGDDVRIGNHVTLFPNVTLMEKTQIGNHVIIHPGTVIGSDGFGFAQDSNQHEKLVHTGYVQINNHVEIGANCTIDRGTLGRTTIGNGVKIDNLVHLAHNVQIGDHALIVAQVGVAGSTEIKNHAIIAGKAGISGHLTIGSHSIVGPMAGVHSNVQDNEIVSGAPQMPHVKWRKVVSIIARLPELRKRLFNLEKRLKDVENDKK